MMESLGALGPWIVGAGGMMAGTAVVGYAWSYLSSAFSFIKDRLITNIEVQSSDPAFVYLMAWVADNHKSKFSRVATRRAKSTNVFAPYEEDVPVDDAKLDLVPRGVIPVQFGGRWHLAWTWQETVQGVMEKRTTLVFQGFWLNHGRFLELADTARLAYESGEAGKQKLFSQDGDQWRPRPSQARRSVSSVVLAEGVWSDILADARHHLGNAKWCAEAGIPWRRGYLFDGPPGNGKSSALRALAGELDLPLYVLNLKSVFSDAMLSNLMASVPSRAILVVEDVDCLLQGRGDLGENGKVSFSGLLNAIDGVDSSEGRILALTTNHPEKLDPALIRPGRVDRRWTFGNPTFEQACEIAIRILDGCDPAADWMAEEIAGKAAEESRSAAWVQGEALQRLASEKGLKVAA